MGMTKEQNKMYYTAKKERIAKEKLEYRNSKYITRKEIAEDLGVKLTYVEGFCKKDRYRMPMHVRVEGISYLYDRKEINEWYPFAMDALAFHKLGGREKNECMNFTFREGSVAHGLITFMQNNKELHLRNIAVRREQGKIYGF